jgi:hypothetical protein
MQYKRDNVTSAGFRPGQVSRVYSDVCIERVWLLFCRAFEEDVAYWVEEEEGTPPPVLDANGVPRKFRINPVTRSSDLFLPYALQKASAWYIVTYDSEFRFNGAGLRSFPWVAAKYLNLIKESMKNR